MRRGLDIGLLEDVIADLAMGLPLPEKNRDHTLSGNWAGHRECHVLPDWLVIILLFGSSVTIVGNTEKRNISTYKLLKDYHVSREMLDNLKQYRSIPMTTLNELCNMLDCRCNRYYQIYKRFKLSTHNIT
jgi:addiction module RelE/StbE family toxin